MKPRVASLDLLRGCAALSVAIPHFLIYFGDGGALLEAISSIAVEVFFVLSGFVLAPQILIVMSGEMRFGLGTFLARRWMRTIPPYLLALALVTVLFGAANATDFWRYLTYTQNLFGQSLSNDYYPVAWSLSVEEWFYAAFPLVLIAASFGRPRSIRFYVWTTLAFIFAITVLRQMFGSTTEWGADVRRVVAFRVDSIAWGFLLYIAIERWPHLARLPTAAALATAALAAALLFDLQFTETSPLAQSAFPFGAAAFGAASICLFIALNPLFENKALQRAASIIGKLSYPVYLYHLLVIYLISRVAIPTSLALFCFCLGTCALSFGSAYLLERPILALRPPYRKREITPCETESFSASAWSSFRSSSSSPSATSPSRLSSILASDATRRFLSGLIANALFIVICAASVEVGYRAYLLLRYPKRFAHQIVTQDFTVFEGSEWRYSRQFGYDYIPGKIVAATTIANALVTGCQTESAVDEQGALPPSTPDFGAADYKILVFGDSMTEGALEGHTWASFLQSKLAQLSGRNIRVMNLARDGYAVLQMFDLAAAKVTELKPDLVVFAFNSSALERPRTWRTQIGDGANVRFVITNDSAPVPDLTFSTELEMVFSGATKDWCEKMKTSTPDAQGRDETLKAVFAKRIYVDAQHPKTPTAKLFDLRSSYAYDQIAHHDPFFSQGAKERPGARLALSVMDFNQDAVLKADIATLKASGVPLLMVHLPLGSSLAEGQEFWFPKAQWPSLLHSLEQLVGQSIVPLSPHIHVAPADAMKLCRAADNCHPSEFGMETYAQAVSEIVFPYLRDALAEEDGEDPAVRLGKAK
jgi:peptidoglycan/LPS O-acetylase OafA/YrhL